MNVELTKKIVGLVAGVGASHVTGTAINALVPQETTVQKTLVFIGKFGIGMVAATAVRKETDAFIDDIALSINAAKQI